MYRVYSFFKSKHNLLVSLLVLFSLLTTIGLIVFLKQNKDTSPRKSNAQGISGYKVGPAYHSTSDNFETDTFIIDYHKPQVRQRVLQQLQALADSGVESISTRVWMVDLPENRNPGKWRLAFPPTQQEVENIRSYVSDVSKIRTRSGGYMDLKFTTLWNGCGDFSSGYQKFCNLTWQDYVSRAKTTLGTIIDAVGNIQSGDGKKTISTFYINGEVVVGVVPNTDKFLLDVYPYFIQKTNQYGLNGSLYFFAAAAESDLFDNSYKDPNYAVLNKHKSLSWTYTTIQFLKNNNLPVNKQIDISFYPLREKVNYQEQVAKFVSDFQSVFPEYTLGIAETRYPPNQSLRLELGQAYLSAYKRTGIPKEVYFWTTPTDSNNGGGFPFDTESYIVDQNYIPTGMSELGKLEAAPNPCLLGSSGLCNSTISWSAANTYGIVSVYVNGGPYSGGALFASNITGSLDAPWITASPNVFYLFSGNVLISSLSVYGQNTGTPQVSTATPSPTDITYATPVPTSVSQTPEPVTDQLNWIKANPNPCLLNGGILCTSTISWQTRDLPNVTIYVNSDPSKGTQGLFAAASEGSLDAPWISKNTNTFYLYSNNNLIQWLTVVGQ